LPIPDLGLTGLHLVWLLTLEIFRVISG